MFNSHERIQCVKFVNESLQQIVELIRKIICQNQGRLVLVLPSHGLDRIIQLKYRHYVRVFLLLNRLYFSALNQFQNTTLGTFLKSSLQSTHESSIKIQSSDICPICQLKSSKRKEIKTELVTVN